MIDIVQIGANIGKDPSCDVIWLQFEYARRPGLSGLFVEPFESSFEKLKEYYSQFENCFFERCAIMEPKFAEENDHVVLNYWDNCPADNCRASVVKTAASFKPNDLQVEVPCMSLPDLLDKYGLRGQEFELLQIDAEGKDYDMILTTNWDNYLPKYIRAETVQLPQTIRNPKRILDKYLSSFGYHQIDSAEDPYAMLAIKWKAELERYNVEVPDLEPAWYNTLWRKECRY